VQCIAFIYYCRDIHLNPFVSPSIHPIHPPSHSLLRQPAEMQLPSMSDSASSRHIRRRLTASTPAPNDRLTML
jgi:hypothetical protein